MMYYSEHRDYPGAKEEFLKNYRPSAGMMFSEGIGAGFRDVSFMLMQSVMEMDKAENAALLTKEDWEASKFYDPQIKWDDSFTTPKARLLKERRDRERELGFLLERAGPGATASFYAGALVGTVPDPVNYIPFVGIASKAKSAAVLGKIAQSGRLGRGATTAADAVLGTALIQPLVAAERDTYQLKYDTRDALTELGLALGLGFGLGAALGRVHPKDPDPAVRAQEGTVTVNRKGEIEIKEGRAPDPETPSTRAAANIAPQDAKTAIDVATAQQAAGESINVGKFAPTQPVRQTADGAAAPEVTPAETFQADARVEPAPDPVPDDTPIDANEARLQQLEAELDERIRTEEAEGRLKEEDATELAYIDEEVKEQELYHQAVFEVTECLIKNG
uniref:Uncharacterized protein n=1 Tax=uncultured marine microorganism HF4000_48F7 TaxID=455500 RepID=B3SZU5_9ZZZZ|nr:hypothetical protein ALOHA_HF400048F7ctg1g20 [uncultured marine microorganism HF4000_48F7]